MGGFGLFGPCPSPVRRVVLRILFWLRVVCSSYVAVLNAVWARRQPLANAGAVLSLLDGPPGVIRRTMLSGSGYMMRRYVACRSSEVGKIYRELDLAREGCPGHGRIHLLVAGAAWDPQLPDWVRPGLPGLSNLAGTMQHFRSAFLDAWWRGFSLSLRSERVSGWPPVGCCGISAAP